MDFNIAVEGMDELRKVFDLLPKRVAVKAASKAVRAGAKVIQDAARAKVPVDTGNLKKSIIVKVLNKKRDAMEVAALIGPSAGGVISSGKNKGRKKIDGFYGFFVEYGTKRSKAEPFMRPAFDENTVAAQQAIVDVIGPVILQEAETLGGTK